MKTRLPLRKLVKLNLMLSLYFALFGFVSTMASLGLSGLNEAIFRTYIGTLLMMLNSFINLGLLLSFEEFFQISMAKFAKRFVFFSYGLNVIVFLFVVGLLSYLKQHTIPLDNLIFSFVISLLLNTLILAFQNYLFTHEKKVSTEIENSQLKAANADAVNQLLRQQIQPHFLFNALNILKSLYKISPKQGEEYLIRLSDFLRAAVSHNNSKVTLVKHEIKHCVDYLEMQRIRFGSALSYSISIDNQTLTSGMVPSFSIQPLLENAIKHNELTEELPLQINIRQEGDRIIVSNSLKPKVSTEASTGSGLANLSERYRLLSDDELIIEETDKTFSVSIKILSHENSNY